MLNAADPPAFRMGNAPLAQALVQVVFPIQASLTSLDRIAPFQDAVRDSFPYMQQSVVQEFAMSVGPAGPAAGLPSQTVNIEFSDDDGWQLTISPGSAALTVGADGYSGSENFEQRLASVLEALEKTAKVNRCDRIGVRYLSIADTTGETAPSDPLHWSKWFKPELLGLSSPAFTDGWLSSSISETRLQRDAPDLLPSLLAPINGVIRSGVVPGGSVIAAIPPKNITNTSFILDIDVFVVAPMHFDPKLIAQTYNYLHREVERVFYWALTESGKEYFELELEDDSEG